MTNQELINKLKEFPEDKEVVFFANEDVHSDEFLWNECFIEDIKECLYIVYDYRIFFSEEDLKEFLLDFSFPEDIKKILKNNPKKEVILIKLNIR